MGRRMSVGVGSGLDAVQLGCVGRRHQPFRPDVADWISSVPLTCVPAWAVGVLLLDRRASLPRHAVSDAVPKSTLKAVFFVPMAGSRPATVCPPSLMSLPVMPSKTAIRSLTAEAGPTTSPAPFSVRALDRSPVRPRPGDLLPDSCQDVLLRYQSPSTPVPDEGSEVLPVPRFTVVSVRPGWAGVPRITLGTGCTGDIALGSRRTRQASLSLWPLGSGLLQ